MLAVTSRGPEDGPGIYSRSRSETLRYGRFNVAVPPEREAGTVTFPDGRTPDPARHFLTVSAQRFADEPAFVAAVNASLARRQRGHREVTVFVHGFNTNFSEGLYRHAQIVHDFGSPGVSVTYAWPSAASVRAYPFDRESALFARDGLERLLDALSRSNAERIVLAGHSHGGAAGDGHCAADGDPRLGSVLREAAGGGADGARSGHRRVPDPGRGAVRAQRCRSMSSPRTATGRCSFRGFCGGRRTGWGRSATEAGWQGWKTWCWST
jgi:hypothetical protein